MGRAALVLVLGFTAVFHVAAFDIQRSVLAAEWQVTERHGELLALNLAESGAEMTLSRLAYNGSWRGWTSNALAGGGTVVAGAVDDTSLGPLGVRVLSYGTYHEQADTVYVRLLIDSRIPGAARGAVTANSMVAGNGGLLLDGRDHDENGNVLPGSGALAISTTATLDLKPNTWLAGTSDSLDYTPHRWSDGGFDFGPLTETGASWPAGYPMSPDGVMGGAADGYPEGRLKEIARSGARGSQYVGPDAVPPSGPGDLAMPLRGVTYVELGPGASWIGADFGDHSSGILVVHNSTRTAVLKNVNNGIFRGLVIADDLVHLHAQIIGALVILSSSPSSGNVVGNGHGSVLYSRATLSRAASGMPGVYTPLDVLSWNYR